MTEPVPVPPAVEGLAVTLARLEGKFDNLRTTVDGLGKQHSMSDGQLQRAIDGLGKGIQEAREEARRDITGARVALEAKLEDLETDLVRHTQSVNPHPLQEEWIRRQNDKLVVEIGVARQETRDGDQALRERIAEINSSLADKIADTTNGLSVQLSAISSSVNNATAQAHGGWAVLRPMGVVLGGIIVAGAGAVLGHFIK